MKKWKNQIFSFKNIFLNSTIITAIIIWLLLLITESPFFSYYGNYIERMNLSFKDQLFTGINSEMKPHDQILIVEIDDKTLKDKDLWWLGRWQEFKREYYKNVIENLNKDWAVVIWLDVIFSEKSENTEDDKKLAEGIKKAWNVILAYQHGLKLYPSKIFMDVASDIWDVYPIINDINKTVYSIYPFYKDFDHKALSIAVLAKYYSIITWEDPNFKNNSNGFSFSNIFMHYSKPHDWKWFPEFLINYIQDYEKFNKISFIDIYKWNYNPSLIKDKIILVWSSATALHDEYSTPEGVIPWVYMHANVINTILNKKILTYFNLYFERIILIAFTWLITLLWMADKKKYYFVSSLIILFLFFIFVYREIYRVYNSIFNYPIYFLVSISLSFILVNIYKYLNEDKWKRVLKWALSQYLAEDLVKQVLDNYEEIKLSWEKKENTIFFSDIAWFTTISENMDAEDLVKFLREYLEKVSDVIIERKWFINKYEWDAVMALWWAFGESPDQAKLACISSIEQQKAIDDLNIYFKEKYDFTISARMGINKWPVIVGNIWSEGKKMEFTALGDNVNLASRLEWINKFYHTLICVSESVKDSVWSEFIFRKLDKIKVKWKNNSVMIYELVWYKEEVSQEKIQIIKKFEEALNLYWSQKFEEAKKIFMELVELEDNVSPVFIERCAHFIIEPPTENWDWSREFTEK